MSEEELLFISEQNEVNLTDEESTWVVNSSASFHLTPVMMPLPIMMMPCHDDTQKDLNPQPCYICVQLLAIVIYMYSIKNI